MPSILLRLGAIGALATLAVACKSGSTKSAPTGAPVSTSPAPAAEPSAGAALEPEPIATADLATLNARGYLRDAFFDFNRGDLRNDARAALDADAQWLKRYASVHVLIEGHSDERGTEEYDLSLGEKRAWAAKDYLESLGVEAARVETVSYGKDRPFCSAHDDPCWQENRRAHFLITAR